MTKRSNKLLREFQLWEKHLFALISIQFNCLFETYRLGVGVNIVFCIIDHCSTKILFDLLKLDLVSHLQNIFLVSNI